MKRAIFTAAAAAALFLTASCQREPAFEQTEEIGPYTVSLIEKNVWHVEDCNSSFQHGNNVMEDGTIKQNNCSDMYIIRGKDKALLIDLSNRINWAEGADEALRNIFYSRAGEREKLITITHNHGDHTGMLYAFENEEDVKFLLPENDFANDKKFPEGRKSLVGDLSVIDLGGMEVECVEVPGHTPGSLVFFLKGHDLAFTGDAIGSGSGVWIFSMDGFRQYAEGAPRLLSYVQDPANGINPDKLIFWGGHFWQKIQGGLEVLDMQYLLDMVTLIDQIGEGTAYVEDYNIGNRMLDANYKYGKATITWNRALGELYAAMKAVQ